ncbi:FAD-dependent monooxygenase [Rheinheimera sp. WS51]|uniref:FAD-dependent monooxygenase n=1 Tax=Rheinheimera sp. WS51 TaxID=3425886 RepID=UPI003D8F3E9A
MQNTDITIVGAGSAGLTLALLLAPLDLNIVLLEQGAAPEQTAAQYQRVSALNLASKRLLSHLGAWPDIAKSAAAYQDMQVWDSDSFAKIAFNAQTEQVEALGWICDNEQIRQALYQQLKQHSNVSCQFNCVINSLVQSNREVLININQQQLILSRLVVGADGINSLVRKAAQLPQMHSHYNQHALVATIKTQLPHQATARQVFLPGGPLALLPLADPHLCSIVWSVPSAEVPAKLALAENEFNQALTAASQLVLGLLSIQSPVRNFELQMRYASQWLEQRIVLVADAAHSVHPLAGQGMNLGLMDVAALAQLIEQQLQAGKDITELRMLRQYERWRKAEAVNLIAAMEAFNRTFSNNNPLLKLARALGMNAVDKAPWLKKQIMAAALGNSGDLPELAKA